MRILISWYNWQGQLEQQEDFEVGSLEQGELAGQYECEQQDFDHYRIQVLEEI